MCVLQVSCCSPFGAFAQGFVKLAAKLYRIIHACKFFIHCCLLCKIIKFICRFFGFSHRAPFAARLVSVRRPIGFRPPSDRLAFAAR